MVSFLVTVASCNGTIQRNQKSRVSWNSSFFCMEQTVNSNVLTNAYIEFQVPQVKTDFIQTNNVNSK